MRQYLNELMAEYETIAESQIGRLEPGLTAEGVLESCRKKTRRLAEIRIKTEAIIKRLNDALENAGEISDEDEKILYETAQKLSAYETRVDPGLAFLIYKTLLANARAKFNENGIIRYSYWCGITLYFLTARKYDDCLSYFDEGAKYSEKYYQIEDPDTRKYIHRCLGNQNMLYYAMEDPERAFEKEEAVFNLWNQIIFRGMDKDFPWPYYFMSCLNHRRNYLCKPAHTDPDSASKELIDQILENAMVINRLYHKNIDAFGVFGGTRYDSALWESQFLAGLISFDIYYENVENKVSEIKPGDFSPDAMYVKLNLRTYIIFYAATMKKLAGVRDAVIERASGSVRDYFESIPMTVSPKDVIDQFLFFANNACWFFKPREHVDFILKMTTFRHIPTYAHSMMAGKIASVLTRAMIDKNPGYFIGMLDLKNEREVVENAEELLSFAMDCGLIHDIGKISYTSNTYMSARVLTEDELGIIKSHPSEGALMIKRDDGDAFFDGYADVILGHHKYYDNTGGFPENYDALKSKYRAMVSIIAVADVLDAATDEIGKTYEDAIGFEEIRGDIISRAGARYSPEIAELLNDPEIEKSIKNLLGAGRSEAYYTAYLRAWGDA